MRNQESWKPGKYEWHKGELRGSRDAKQLRVGSRLITDLLALEFRRGIESHVRGNLIDLGCGKAPLYGCYREFAESVTCVDWASTKHDQVHLDYECDLTQELPFADGQFDSLIFSDVLEHLPDPSHIWQEISRILAPEGKLLLSTPFFYPLHEAPHDYFRYSRFALRRFAAEHKLLVLNITSIGGTLDVLADILAKHLEVIPVIGKISSIATQKLAEFAGRTKTGRRLRAFTGTNFPLCYFMVAQKPSEDRTADVVPTAAGQ